VPTEFKYHPSEYEYQPSDDEPFMNDRQKDYFRRKLLDWKEEILRESRETLLSLQEENHALADVADRASNETDRSLELRTRDRQRKLIAKIDAALPASTRAPTAIARRPASRSACAASTPGRSRRSRSRPRSATNAASGSTATIEPAGGRRRRRHASRLLSSDASASKRGSGRSGRLLRRRLRRRTPPGVSA
jgi:RNA polymerase-binding protein DksA